MIGMIQQNELTIIIEKKNGKRGPCAVIPCLKTVIAVSDEYTMYIPGK